MIYVLQLQFQYIRYNPMIMEGKTERDKEAILKALLTGKNLHVIRVDNEFMVTDIICFIAIYRMSLYLEALIKDFFII